jgi:hypothetical protein
LRGRLYVVGVDGFFMHGFVGSFPQFGEHGGEVVVCGGMEVNERLMFGDRQAAVLYRLE